MNSKKIKLIGQNLGRGIAAGDNLKQIVIEEDVSIALVQEPYVQIFPLGQRLGGEGGGIQAIYKNPTTGCETRAAILFKGKSEHAPKLVNDLSTNDIATAMWRCDGKPLVLVSCYLHSDDNLENALNRLVEIVRYSSGNGIIIHGDFNSRSSDLTGDKTTNKRGRLLEEWAICNNLFMHNKKGVQTYWVENKNGKVKSSIIDYTFTSSNLINRVEDWHVPDTASLSDHRTIRFELTKDKTPHLDAIRAFDFAKADWNHFAEVLGKPALMSPESADQIEYFTEHEMSLLQEACRSSIPSKNIQKHRYWWWSSKLSKMKTDVNKAKKRRDRTLTTDPEIRSLMAEEYRRFVLIYKKELSKAKRKSFQKFCTDINPNNFWQKLKQLKHRPQLPVMLTKRNGVICKDETKMGRELLDAFFPDAESDQLMDGNIMRQHNHQSRPFDALSKTKDVVKHLQNRKTPGLDGTNGYIFKKYFEIRGQTFAAMMEACVNVGYFPTVWKTGKVVPIPKGNRKRHSSSSDRLLFYQSLANAWKRFLST